MPIAAQSGGLLLLLLFLAAVAPLASPHSCPFTSPAADHDHDHDHIHDHSHDHHHYEIRRARLPEELAEEEDLILDQFDHHHHHHHHHEHETDDSGIGLWVRAMGCSMLVSLASLVCLVLLPVFFLQGKPSKGLVDSLAVFGAGAMLGDAFLHQLPHAFGGGHAYSHHNHDHHEENGEHSHSNAHSLQDLSVGLSVLVGIILFLIVEKVVRYVEENSGNGVHGIGGHGHHHHHKKKLDDEQPSTYAMDGKTRDTLDKTLARDILDKTAEGKSLNNESGANGAEGDPLHQGSHIRQRVNVTKDDVDDSNAKNGAAAEKSLSTESFPSPSQSSLVFGYLNLFSDGVHNFTDGMALGSAFLLHGSVGGWSRTLFLLAHELPQEVGDFGILVRSGFTVTKALFFNFLSAIVALAGTALALVLGKDPGHSSLIEGFTAGGFIYIAVAGVLPELNSGKTTFKTTLSQLTALVLGMTVALCISLFE